MTPAVLAEDLSAGYGGRAVLSGVSFAADPGQTVCVLGPNGGERDPAQDGATAVAGRQAFGEHGGGHAVTAPRRASRALTPRASRA